MNSSPSDLMSYCSWAKKNSGYRESIRDYFYGDTLYYRDFYAFSHTIGDALKEKILLKINVSAYRIIVPKRALWQGHHFAIVLLFTWMAH